MRCHFHEDEADEQKRDFHGKMHLKMVESHDDDDEGDEGEESAGNVEMRVEGILRHRQAGEIL